MTQDEPINVTRQDLYDQIWSMPVSRACRLYGLSDVSLANICDDWEIPRPPRGYWSKKRNGKPVRQKKLKPIEEGNPVIFSYQPQPAMESETQREPTASERQRSFEKRPENRIQLPTQLVDPHPLVSRTGTSIRNARPNDEGLVRPRAQKCLNLSVSPDLIDRSLLILDTLIKALETRGLRVSVVDGEYSRTEARVLDEGIGFKLFEATVLKERPPTKQEINWELRLNPNRKFYTMVPSGKLVLKITDGSGLQRCWTDRSDRRVEQFLNSFIVGLVRAAEIVKQQRIDAEKRRKEAEEAKLRRQEEEQQRQAEERRRREEEARIYRLLAEAAAWDKAQQIRNYLAAVKTSQEGWGGIVPGDELDSWLKWAVNWVDAIDPCKKARVS